MSRFLEELDRRKRTAPKTVRCRWCGRETPASRPERAEREQGLWCGKPTEMTATRLCDAHWELERRITAEPHIAARILAKINSE